MNKINRIDIKEFREQGYLREVNRRFFHRLGLALEVLVLDSGLFDGDEKDIEKFNEELTELYNKIFKIDLTDYQESILKGLFSVAKNGFIISGVRDYRDDPEGIYFGSIDKSAVEKGKRITEEMKSKKKAREKLLGFDIQPLEEHEIDIR